MYEMYKSSFVFIVGLFLSDATQNFNPLLTYSVRFKKMTCLPAVTGNYTINQDREKQTISGNFTNGFTELDSVIVTFYRCDSEGINCEYFQTWNFSDACSKVNQKNQLWSSWYGAYRPPIECPINKVNYELINGYIDVGPVLQWYPEAINYHWKVVQKFHFGQKFVGGFTLDLYFFGYRKRAKSIPNS